MNKVAPEALPRLAAVVRLLLQLRMLLAAIALLLIPAERLTAATFTLILAFALLSGLAARFWERFVPYLRSHPLLVTLDVLVLTAILVVEGPSGPAFIITVLTAAISGTLFGERGMAAVTLLQILCYVVALVSYAAMSAAASPIQVFTIQVLLVHPLLYPISGYCGLKIRDVLAELASEQAARQAAERAAAAAEERDRLARDMHDSVAKTLRGAALAAQSLPMWLTKDPQRAVRTAAQVANAAETAAAEARALISDLRAPSVDSVFGKAIRETAAEWSAQSEIDITVSAPDGDVGLFTLVQQESLAILKEALANIERHAEAQRVHVSVELEGDHCTLTITDDGKGFTKQPNALLEEERTGNGHYGLLGMVERAERVGGTLGFESSPNEGTKVLIRVPVADPHYERVAKPGT
ncbi:hypothetical protein GCM10009799_32750 [Nocardiopsis rhodophaea]|uniref:Histidine kinase/HSP90-like ATPase domain-containing protein n=1 Tax=Nocardiopsis rhodophaea TaxID=280238 RepID=A0ABN2TAK7_9ACTN